MGSPERADGDALPLGVTGGGVPVGAIGGGVRGEVVAAVGLVGAAGLVEVVGVVEGDGVGSSPPEQPVSRTAATRPAAVDPARRLVTAGPGRPARGSPG
jgi:hypothetical protein